jgi:hypothetical protein
VAPEDGHVVPRERQLHTCWTDRRGQCIDIFGHEKAPQIGAYVTAPREAEAPYMIFLRWHEDELVGAGPVNIARGALVVATIAETCKNFSPLL